MCIVSKEAYEVIRIAARDGKSAADVFPKLINENEYPLGTQQLAEMTGKTLSAIKGIIRRKTLPVHFYIKVGKVLRFRVDAVSYLKSLPEARGRKKQKSTS